MPMFDKKYKISIVIPVYNAQDYLEECLESVFASKKIKDLQIICVNDGSTDKSPEILEKIKRRKNIEIINTKNLGASKARNTGLQFAKGKYLSFIDADDFIPDDYYSTLYKEAIENNADVVMTGFNLYSEDDVVEFPCYEDKIITDFSEKCDLLVNGAVWNKLFRTSCIIENHLNFENGRTWEDNLFSIKALYYCKTMKAINGPKYNYRSDHYSVTHDYTERKRAIDAVYIYRKAMKFAAKVGMTKDEINALNLFFKNRATPGYI